MIQYESRDMVYKSINGLPPHYFHDLFFRNIENRSYQLRNTATEFQIPKRNRANGQKGFGGRTDLFLPVYLPSSKYDMQLDITCCNVSAWRKEGQLDDL